MNIEFTSDIIAQPTRIPANNLYFNNLLENSKQHGGRVESRKQTDERLKLYFTIITASNIMVTLELSDTINHQPNNLFKLIF